MTFKRKIEGNYIRREIEMPLNRSQAQDLLNGSLGNLEQIEAISEALPLLKGQQIQPLLLVQNTREVWSLRAETGRLRICFDAVRYTGPHPSRWAEEYELELELEDGEERFLQKIVQALSQEYELIPNSSSKYERGIALLGVFATLDEIAHTSTKTG